MYGQPLYSVRKHSVIYQAFALFATVRFIPNQMAANKADIDRDTEKI